MPRSQNFTRRKALWTEIFDAVGSTQTASVLTGNWQLSGIFCPEAADITIDGSEDGENWGSYYSFTATANFFEPLDAQLFTGLNYVRLRSTTSMTGAEWHLVGSMSPVSLIRSRNMLKFLGSEGVALGTGSAPPLPPLPYQEFALGEFSPLEFA